MEGAQKAGESGEMDGEDVTNTEDVEDNSLWEQMTAREEREAARRAGMRAGDWRTERQLQEALRESRMEDGKGGSSRGETTQEEGSNIGVDFHTLGTDAVEGEQGQKPELSEQGRQGVTQPGNNSLPSGKDTGGAAGVRTAGRTGARAEARRNPFSETNHAKKPSAEIVVIQHKQDPQDAEGIEDDEDFGEVELVVTEDGGIIPVVSGAVTAAAAAAVAAATATRTRTEAYNGEGVSAIADRRGSARCRLSEGGVWGESKVDFANRAVKRSAVVGARATVVVHGTAVTDNSDGASVTTENRVPALSEADHGAVSLRDDGARGPADTDVEGGGERVEGVNEAGDEAAEGREEGEEEEEELPFDILLTLDDDVLHGTMLYLHPEDLVECRVVSSRWKFPLGEAVFEGLCRRTYLAQSAKKLLNVQRWRSWQRMFKLRPRLRTTGMYSMKTTYYKKPVRDMSTTWVPGQILECTYYRYFRFFGDGRIAYGLTHEPPREFVRMLEEEHPKVMFGTYTISKWDVKVDIPTPWAHVSFTLQLANGERGRFTHLILQRHSSVPRNDPRAGRCHHSVKSSDVFTVLHRVGTPPAVNDDELIPREIHFISFPSYSEFD